MAAVDSHVKHLQEHIMTATLDRVSVWRQLTCRIRTGEDALIALRAQHIRLGKWALAIMQHPSFKGKLDVAPVELVQITTASLGYPDGGFLKQIYARARDLGLDLCPCTVGCELRLEYDNQPLGEELLVAMEPIPACRGELGIFWIGNDEKGPWLYERTGDFLGYWGPDTRWIFALTR